MANERPRPERGLDRNLRLCGGCGLVVHQADHCPRCHTQVYDRKPRSLEYSWALLITAVFLLFPANSLYITQLTNQGRTTYDTIYSGIVALVESDMVGIAIIVFTASILVPMAKIIGLSLILMTIQFRLKMSRRQLTFSFHVIEFIGRWSMLDLFVISIMVSLVNMGQLLHAKPAPAATFFALVILFTQLAAKTLDPRLLWDLECEEFHDRHQDTESR
ncbi:paraquat-inducible protein A [Ferrimonas balearica]|uniref:paraquat-inducible protein A n=1 Tax=Ferrimonas balearica TaxID=44012 RepID=UPI001C97FBA7|nr:paraquat-inducible protein A [Ferrimonas balearica]MBY5979764.1 paraquat-inducible protein A [Ferrimonas balearica]